MSDAYEGETFVRARTPASWLEPLWISLVRNKTYPRLKTLNLKAAYKAAYVVFSASRRSCARLAAVRSTPACSVERQRPVPS